MAAPKLNEEQRSALLKWLAAEYSEGLISKWFVDREWPVINSSSFAYYRKRWADEIATAREGRRSKAMSEGLALKEERLQRLAEHADELEAIKWVPDEKTGRLWNEKAWRETLDDIAREMGHRRQGIDIAVEQELEAALDRLRNVLSDEEYARALAALRSG